MRFRCTRDLRTCHRRSSNIPVRAGRICRVPASPPDLNWFAINVLASGVSTLCLPGNGWRRDACPLPFRLVSTILLASSAPDGSKCKTKVCFTVVGDNCICAVGFCRTGG
jgi:hypothetical protein